MIFAFYLIEGIWFLFIDKFIILSNAFRAGLNGNASKKDRTAGRAYRKTQEWIIQVGDLYQRVQRNFGEKDSQKWSKFFESNCGWREARKTDVKIIIECKDYVQELSKWTQSPSEKSQQKQVHSW
jgi:hypothetical protein